MSDNIDRPRITVTYNGLKREVAEGTLLSELLDYFVANRIPLVVVRNAAFVPSHEYSVTRLENGDQIQFIDPASGG
jgi:thiamine biosynthesis protein ThiS